ncbi:hypothetical protein AGMMS50230_22000 [Spirochaetia bacterium]|nr:hypothetical protein AGMMS50230_22000 [Spirochaetia bacterium]
MDIVGTIQYFFSQILLFLGYHFLFLFPFVAFGAIAVKKS